MRPHTRYDSRGNRNAEEEDDRYYDRQSSDHRHYSRSSSASMSRPSTRGYRYDSQEAVRSYRADNVGGRDYGSTRQNRSRDERSWERGGWEDRGRSESGSGRGRYASERSASRDYDGYRGRDYAPTHWDQRNYTSNRAYSYNDSDRDYNYDHGRTSSYGRNGGYSQSTYTGGYRHSSNNSDQASRRGIHGDRRRGYHSSTSRSASNANNEANRSGRGPLSDSTTPSLASRLFQHRETLTRFDPGRSIRNTRTTPPRPPQPTSYPPKRATSMKKPGPSEEYLKISLERSERAGRADEDVDLDVDVESLVRKLLVLDLNGTLVYRSPHKRWHERFSAPGVAAVAGGEEDVYAQFDPLQPRPFRTVYPRPYLTSFRDYLFHPSTKRWLDTMVWSSAQPHSVGDMVEKCFGDRKDGLVAIWARDRLGLNQSDYGRKVQTTKDLNKPWGELSSTSSATTTQKMNHSAKTTLLLDDSPLKAHLQPYNHLCIKEYDLEMRKHDIGVRELDVARNRLADVIAGKKGIEDVLRQHKTKDNGTIDEAAEPNEADAAVSDPKSSTATEHAAATDTRKRKRKEKKENKKKERIEQQLEKLTSGSENPAGVYDETLLAVIGILDAVKRESNVAAWVRAGGLIKSLIEGVDDKKRGDSVSSATSVEIKKSPRKKMKLSREESTSSPPRATSPISAESDDESETERTGVPLEDTPNEDEPGKGAKNVEEQLWFSHTGTVAYWASRGRRVLELMGIDVVVGVVGPTG